MVKRVGIILAGGTGSRLSPITRAISKQLVPVYDKPLIYYSLSVLMLADIREILLITNPNSIEQFKQLLGDGSNFGIHIEYAIQNEPNGIAEALIIAKQFVKEKNIALILGDNIFYGPNLRPKLLEASRHEVGATLFTYEVQDPEKYGVAEIDENLNVVSIQEKPKKPKSNYAVTGLYFFDNKAITYAESIQPSSRGELEITDVNRMYLENRTIKVKNLGRGYVWYDAGTHENLFAATSFVQTIQSSQGFSVACLEEIALKNEWISEAAIQEAIIRHGSSSYSNYLKRLLVRRG